MSPTAPAADASSVPVLRVNVPSEQSATDPLPAPPAAPINPVILVVGADTHTGNYIARALLRDPTGDIHVKVAARRFESVQDLVRAGATFHELKVAHERDAQELDKLYADAHTAILCLPGVPGIEDLAQHHYDAMVRARTTRCVLLSRYRPDRGYPGDDVWKAFDALEQSARSTLAAAPGRAVELVILRVGYVQQSLLHLAELVSARGVLPLPLGTDAGKAKFAPVNLKDVAVAARACVLGGRRVDGVAGKTYSLTGREVLSGPDMAREASDEFGAEVVYYNIKDEGMRRILANVPGMTGWDIEITMATYADIRDGYHVTASEDLAYFLARPAETVREFLHENATSFRP